MAELSDAYVRSTPAREKILEGAAVYKLWSMIVDYDLCRYFVVAAGGLHIFMVS
jgi:hypothetical protein